MIPVKSKIRDRIIHAFAALLLSAGIIMPLLGILDRSFLDARLLLLCAAIIILFELISFHRICCPYFRNCGMGFLV